MVSFWAFSHSCVLKDVVYPTKHCFHTEMTATGPDVAEKRRREYPWTPELDSLLEQGYRVGLAGQRAAIDRIQRRIDLGWLQGSHEGKNRDDDTLRISDEQFLEFWRNHPEQVAVHRWNREGLEWLLLLLGETRDQNAIEPQREELRGGLSMSTE